MKILANDATNKGLIFKTHKSSYSLISEENTIKNWAEDLNRHFSKEDI